MMRRARSGIERVRQPTCVARLSPSRDHMAAPCRIDAPATLPANGRISPTRDARPALQAPRSGPSDRFGDFRRARRRPAVHACPVGTGSRASESVEANDRSPGCHGTAAAGSSRHRAGAWHFGRRTRHSPAPASQHAHRRPQAPRDAGSREPRTARGRRTPCRAPTHGAGPAPQRRNRRHGRGRRACHVEADLEPRSGGYPSLARVTGRRTG